ncbi:RNA binding motif protein 11 [Danio aesculapii]|uniref:RNA binding motif protein 11 n=1 Tax=Danio aesculapii TaxID=1142201 RepID=UPI0024BFE6B0|nr:RNA binding motif protein 11 [Danio aesculapii]
MSRHLSLSNKTIIVGNIHRCVTEEILFELFLQAGPVAKVHICRDGQQAPYACVYYKHAEAVPYAVELLNGIWLYGQPIKLQCNNGDHYHRSDVFAFQMENGLITNSADSAYRDNMVSNLNGSPGVESHSNGWSDMVYRRPLEACPPVVWYCPPLQQWMESGYPPRTSCLNENLLLCRSASAKRRPYGGHSSNTPTPLTPTHAQYITKSDCML